MIQALLGLLPAVANKVGDYVINAQTAKAEAAAAEARLERAMTDAKIRHVETAQAAEIDWDMMAMQNTSKSLKDEYWVFVLSIPMIMSFIPGLAQYVDQGFQAFTATPLWYQTSVGVAIAASFGYKKLADWMYSNK